MKTLEERLRKYISFDTMSDEESETCPSTEGQRVLGQVLVEELKELGLEEVNQDLNGYVYGSLAGNVEGIPAIGLIAHMDTSPDAPGKVDDPQVLQYEGGTIPLSEKKVLSPDDFPFLNDLVGQTLMTTRGDTLLGADDKAGIAIIMHVLETLVRDPSIPHGPVKVAFTPDEEIGRGADKFDVEAFGADFAFTIDGGEMPGFEYETFNAASARLEVEGKNVHPGSAKGTMVSAAEIAQEFHSLLPAEKKPQYTEGREGFIHLLHMEGTVDHAKMDYIIRDHDRAEFQALKEVMEGALAYINKKHGSVARLEIKDSYYNMREKVEEHPEIIALVKRAFAKVGLEPEIVPVRGGTDGAGLSFKGLPTPNLFTGGYNYHGVYEFISLDQMARSAEVVLSILQENTRKN